MLKNVVENVEKMLKFNFFTKMLKMLKNVDSKIKNFFAKILYFISKVHINYYLNKC